MLPTPIKKEHRSIRINPVRVYSKAMETIRMKMSEMLMMMLPVMMRETYLKRLLIEW